MTHASARVKFISFEPLLEGLGKINFQGIDWAIVGGESGPRARPMNKEWVVGIRDQCKAAGVPFFFKQWGGTNKKKAGRLLDGRTWDELPGGACNGYVISETKNMCSIDEQIDNILI